MDDRVTQVSAERGKQYGDFADIATFIETVMDMVYAFHNDDRTAAHVEALHMIAHKMARLVVGDPNHQDSWLDIAGYAMLGHKASENITKSNSTETDDE